LKQKAQDFDKRYAYNIRHLYGAVGACKDYPAFSCDDLIESRKGLNPPSGQCGHGCPYKHWDDARLRQTLASSRLAPLDIEDVCKLAAEGRYQRACQRHFEVRHPFCAHLKDTVNHPNQYFRASVDYHAGMRGASAAGVGSPGEELEESDDEDAENGSGDEQVLAHSCRLDQDA
jgi:DNA primase large subunit